MSEPSEWARAKARRVALQDHKRMPIIEAIARALDEAKVIGIGIGREACATAIYQIAARHREASRNCYAEFNVKAARVADYAARCVEEIADAIRAAPEFGGSGGRVAEVMAEEPVSETPSALSP